MLPRLQHLSVVLSPTYRQGVELMAVVRLLLSRPGPPLQQLDVLGLQVSAAVQEPAVELLQAGARGTQSLQLLGVVLRRGTLEGLARLSVHLTEMVSSVGGPSALSSVLVAVQPNPVVELRLQGIGSRSPLQWQGSPWVVGLSLGS